MMRRGPVLAAMALIVCALAALWLALRQPTSAAQEPAAAPQAAYEMLYQRPLSAFAGMAVQLASGESYAVRSDMVFDEGGALLGVRTSLAQPLLVEGREDFALDATAYQMMLLAAQNLPYTAAYDSLDRDACGLSSPAARITITYTDGDPIELSIGRLTASGYSCYVAMAGDDRVYLVPYDFHQVMTRPLNDHHRLPTAITRDAAGAVQIAQVTAEQTMWLATRREGQLLPWQLERPIAHGGSTQRIEAYIAGVCAIHAEAYEATVTDAAGLAAYGLDAPQRLAVSFSDGTIRDIHLGGDAGGGQVYVRMDKTGDVYRVSRAQLAFLDEAGAGLLLDRFVALVPSDGLDSVTLAWPEGSCTLACLPQGEQTAYTRDGQAISAASFADAYRALVGLQFDQLAGEDGVKGDMLAQATFRLADGTTQAVTFSAWNHYYALAENGGGGSFMVRLTRLDAMLQAFQGKEEEP